MKIKQYNLDLPGKIICPFMKKKSDLKGKKKKYWKADLLLDFVSRKGSVLPSVFLFLLATTMHLAKCAQIMVFKTASAFIAYGGLVV